MNTIRTIYAAIFLIISLLSTTMFFVAMFTENVPRRTVPISLGMSILSTGAWLFLSGIIETEV